MIGNSKTLFMKHLLLFFLFSGSLDGFSQDTGYFLKAGKLIFVDSISTTTDTIRCTLIVYYDSGPAILHTKPGFMVRRFMEIVGYLDDKKRVIKAPWIVYDYRKK